MPDASQLSDSPLPDAPSFTELFRVFFLIGLTSFGITMLENLRRVALRRGLVSEEELREGLAMVQLYPGPMMFDLVTFIGYRRLGTIGAMASALGFILPATLLMLAVAWLYGRYGELPAIRMLSAGLGAAVVGAIAHIAVDFAKKNLAGAADWGFALCAFAAAVLRVDALVVIAGGFGVGTIFWRDGSKQETAIPVGVRQTRFDLAGPFAVCMAVILAAVLSAWSNVPFPALITVFMKIGATAFGNASTILPVMQAAVVQQQSWLSATEFNVAVALGNLTPGPVLNSATFIGYRVAGLPGGITATLAIFAPSFAMTLFFTELFARIRHLGWVRGSIRGVMSVFVGLLASTCLTMALPMAGQPAALGVGLLTFALLRLTKLNMGWVFLIALTLWIGVSGHAGGI